MKAENSATKSQKTACVVIGTGPNWSPRRNIDSGTVFLTTYFSKDCFKIGIQNYICIFFRKEKNITGSGQGNFFLVGVMAYQIKALSAKPDWLSSISDTHRVEGKS